MAYTVDPIEVYEVRVTHDSLVITFAETKAALEVFPDGMVHVFENYENDMTPSKQLMTSKKLYKRMHKKA